MCVCVEGMKGKRETDSFSYAVERLIRDHCQIDGDDLINYEGIQTLSGIQALV